jgi:hypothetical protein
MSATLLQPTQPFVETNKVSLKQLLCDSCGGAASAKYTASNGTLELNFCGHHVRFHADDLISKGWKITPEDISFEAEEKHFLNK